MQKKSIFFFISECKVSSTKSKLRKKDYSTKQFCELFVLFAFKIIEDTYHSTPVHNVDNCFNNGHNA